MSKQILIDINDYINLLTDRINLIKSMDLNDQIVYEELIKAEDDLIHANSLL